MINDDKVTEWHFLLSPALISSAGFMMREVMMCESQFTIGQTQKHRNTKETVVVLWLEQLKLCRTNLLSSAPHAEESRLI